MDHVAVLGMLETQERLVRRQRALVRAGHQRVHAPELDRLLAERKLPCSPAAVGGPDREAVTVVQGGGSALAPDREAGVPAFREALDERLGVAAGERCRDPQPGLVAG